MSENPENLKRELLAPLSSCYKRSSRHTTLLFVVASSIYLNFTIMHSVFDFKYFRLFVGNICVALPWNLMMKVVHRTRVMGLVSQLFGLELPFASLLYPTILIPKNRSKAMYSAGGENPQKIIPLHIYYERSTRKAKWS